jgi:class 3 adenylate cyclase
MTKATVDESLILTSSLSGDTSRAETANRIFRSYRLALSGILLVVYFLGGSETVFASKDSLSFLYGATIWFLLVMLESMAARLFESFSVRTTLFNFIADMLFLAFLGHASGGVDSGIFYLMLPSAALAGLVLPQRLALFVAALASLAALYAQLLIALESGGLAGPFISAGMLGALLFAATMTFSVLEQITRRAEEKALEEARHKEEARSILGKVVSPQVAATLMGSDIELGGVETNISVLFSDIRNFTAFSEAMSPSEILHMLNHYFTSITEQIEKHSGIVDKYIGDAVMALFGAPLVRHNHAELAVHAALDMQKAIAKLANSPDLMGQSLVTGIGINTCDAVVGNMGSISRMNYTAIGDGVNLASRIEALTKVYKVGVIVSESTRAAAPDFFYRELDVVRVRGREQAVTIYQPICTMNEVDEELKRRTESYHQAVQSFRARQWQQARDGLNELMQDAPERLYEIYLESCNAYAAEEPSPDWDGGLKIN